MKPSFVLVVFLLMSLIACSEFESDCLEMHAEEFKKQRLDCKGSSIIKYEFQGKTVYAFSDGQCIADGGSNILDSECTEICFLGGIEGFS